MLENRIKETATIDGLNPIALTGAIPGNRAYGEAFANGSTVIYVANQLEQWEIGYGVYDDDDQTISRDYVYNSSNDNDPVVFVPGTVVVFNDMPIQFFSVTAAPDLIPRGNGSGELDPSWLPSDFGTGNVTGPDPSTINSVPRWDDTGGTLLADTALIIHPTANDKLQTNATFMAWITNTDGSIVTIDLDESDKHVVTYAGNRTLDYANASVGQRISLLRNQDGTGGRVESWFSNILWDNNLEPIQDPSVDGWDLVVLDCIGTDYLDTPIWVEVSRTTSAPRCGITVATDAATVVFDLRVSPKQQVTLGGDRTLQVMSSHVGQTFAVKLIQDGSGNRTVTWDFGTIVWSATGGSEPVLPTASGASTWLCFVQTGSNTYECVGCAGAQESLVSDVAYNATTWNAVTNVAPSKNAVRDEFELRVPTSRTVAGHALSADVTLQASDLTNGITGTGQIVLDTNPTISNLSVTDLTVNGTTTTVNTATLTVDDPLIRLADNNAADVVDVGFYALYSSSGAKYSGLFRDASDGKYKLFTALQDEPTTTVDVGGTGYTTATLVATLEGNATTATILQTTRTINGVSFNGSADITVTAAAGTLTGTTLNATVVTSSLTTVGSLTSLTVAGVYTGKFDVSNYYTTTVDSTGVVTFDATGTAPSFTFADKTRIGASVVGVLIDSDLGGVNEVANDNVLYVATQTGAGTALFDKFIASGDGAGLILRRARGTAASPTDVANTDQIGYIDFRSYSDTKFFQCASIAAHVDGTFTTGQAPPSRLVFSTNIANGASTNQMRLTSQGYLLIGTASMPSFASDARLVVKQLASISDFTATFQAGTNSGTSYGVAIKGGTTSADYGLTVADTSNTNELFRVKGAGNTWISNALVIGRTVGTTPTGTCDALFSTNPTADAQTAYGAYLECDTTNSAGYTSYQPIGVGATVRYRGTTSESTSTKGARAFDGSMFVYNTGTTQYASGTRYDIRNLSTGTVTNMAGVWVPTMLNSGGGTITTIFGIRIDAQAAAGTNYGAYLNLAAGSTSWNIYSLGTAKSYHEGSLGVGTNTVSAAKCTILSTTTQEAWQYDASNYANITVTSTGQTTIAATGTNAGITITPSGTGKVILSTIPRFNGTNSTGAGTPLFGTNSPAVTNTNPYTWISIVTSDGSAAFVPAWK